VGCLHMTSIFQGLQLAVVLLLLLPLLPPHCSFPCRGVGVLPCSASLLQALAMGMPAVHIVGRSSKGCGLRMFTVVCWACIIVCGTPSSGVTTMQSCPRRHCFSAPVSLHVVVGALCMAKDSPARCQA
jgi:uncharacterized membrane protein (DUF4010 family)